MYPILSLLNHFAVTVRGCEQDVCDAGGTLPHVSADSGQVAGILQIVFMVIGIIALIYIILAGLKLILSLGDNPEILKNTRQSIIYAAVGLAICLSAELIVTTVLKKL